MTKEAGDSRPDLPDRPIPDSADAVLHQWEDTLYPTPEAKARAFIGLLEGKVIPVMEGRRRDFVTTTEDGLSSYLAAATSNLGTIREPLCGGHVDLLVPHHSGVPALIAEAKIVQGGYVDYLDGLEVLLDWFVAGNTRSQAAMVGYFRNDNFPQSVERCAEAVERAGSFSCKLSLGDVGLPADCTRTSVTEHDSTGADIPVLHVAVNLDPRIKEKVAKAAKAKRKPKGKKAKAAKDVDLLPGDEL